MAVTDRAPMPAEELLAVDEIQGNILAGFNKDHQVFLFLRMEEGPAHVEAVRSWIRAIAPQVNTAAEVHAYNKLFKALRKRQGRDPHGLVGTWLHIAFSRRALELLTSPADVALFTDSAFQDGLAVSASDLGDPADPASEGSPERWVVGGHHTPVDVVLIVASDSPVHLSERVTQLKATLTSAHAGGAGGVAAALRLVWEQAGDTLPPPLTGHEHFGFKDGISQPGVRGLIGRDPQEYLTPRLVDAVTSPQDDPLKPEFAEPGQPLVWPGQFVFGYFRQARQDPRTPPPPPIDKVDECPPWGVNGSYLVIRRLRQDVGAFWAFVTAEATRLGQQPAFAHMTPTLLASKLVGRWPNGESLMRTAVEDSKLAADPYALNYFQYAQDSPPPLNLLAKLGYGGDGFALSRSDLRGIACPLSAHVRKVNPRDGLTEQASVVDVLARMILRRGIPFGPPYPRGLDETAGTAALAAGNIDAERGLMFVSYQTSIVDQFAFLQKLWANHVTDPNDGGGRDPIIGQTDANGDRRRRFQLPGASGAPETLLLPQDFVVPTGGGFFFSPSISALVDVLGRSAAVPANP
jgi:Dyp-type peroxidase family